MKKLLNNPKTLNYSAIVLLVLFCLFVLPQLVLAVAGGGQDETASMTISSSEEMAAMMDNDEHNTSSGHSHKKVEVDSDQPIPAVNVNLIPQEDGNYTLTIAQANFNLVTPGDAPESIFGEGHAHLYINGESQ